MKIVFATNNEHKLSEIRDILGDKMEVLSLNDIGCHEDIPETGQTLEENALQKAQYVYDHYGYNVFSDDTGLEVDALGGAPGVHTARYAGGEGHDAEANTRKLLYELRDQDNRKARFRTAIALICNKEVNYFEGIVEGEITREKRGEKGFGYDPVFKPDGYDGTFAELGVEVKNQISHRARAVQKLVKYLSSVMCCLLALLPINVNAQTGTWHNYLAYYDVQDICKAFGFEILEDLLAAFGGGETGVLLACFGGHFAIKTNDGNHWEVVALADFVIVWIMGWCNFYNTRAIFHIGVFVGDNRNLAVGKG